MSVADNIAFISKKIANAAREAGRDPSDVKLVAVSKMQSEARVEEALAAGQRVFGENRVQEALSRWLERKLQYPDLELHLVGPLQTNKIKDALKLFDVIESVDREKLARKLADEMAAQGKDLPCYIQVNTGEEPQKSGILPSETADFYDYCRGECGLDIGGLMCIPPLDEPPALHFALLAKLGQVLELPALSMGMSGDFEDAVRLGATSVRIGSALFGSREKD